MSHGRRREIITSLHKCMDYEKGKWGVDRALCRVPLKYGGTAAFSWSFADKERRTPYILRRHCINACYSCSAFVGLHPPFSILSLSLSSSPFLSPSPSLSLSLSLLSLSLSLSLSLPLLVFALFALSFSFSLCHSLRFSRTPASYVSTDVQFISYVTSSTYIYIRRSKKT